MPGRGGRNRTRNPQYYWNNVAKPKPEAQALADSLCLEFPTSPSGFQGTLMYPIRRLITTGEDTPENLALLLGPLWETHAGETIKQARIDVLICPPPGSPHSVSFAQLDAGSPRWAPRAANADEERELAKVRDMKSKISAQVGDRKDINNDDVKMILSRFGNHWAEALPILESAMNSTDQGVYP